MHCAPFLLTMQIIFASVSYRRVVADLRLNKEVTTKQSQIESVEDMLIMDKSHSDRYNRILERYEKEVSELQTRISTLELSKRENIEPKLSYAIMLINNIDSYIRDAPLETKIKLIGSIFDDKIEYDGEKYRTNSYNKVLDLIFQQTNELRGKEKEKGEKLSSFSVSVPRPGTSHRNNRKTKEFIFLIISYLHISYFLHLCPILPVFCYSVHF